MKYIPRTTKKKAYYNTPDISLRKNLHSRTAEALDIKDTILFNNNHFR